MSLKVLETQDFIMNTGVEQKIIGNDPEAVYTVTLNQLRQLEDMMSFYKEASEVSLLNRNAGKFAVRMSKNMMAVLKSAKGIASRSDNAFNVMLAPPVQLWNDDDETLLVLAGLR